MPADPVVRLQDLREGSNQRGLNGRDSQKSEDKAGASPPTGWATHPVVLRAEVDEAGGHAETLKGVESSDSLALEQAVIASAVCWR